MQTATAVCTDAQISIASCSARPGRGCAWDTGTELLATTAPWRSTRIALVAPVPSSTARIVVSAAMAQHLADRADDAVDGESEVLEQVARVPGRREDIGD